MTIAKKIEFNEKRISYNIGKGIIRIKYQNPIGANLDGK